MTANSEKQENDPVQLKRELGLFSAINFIISVTIGSGIFISPTSVLRYSKSVGMCFVVWSLCGVISLLGALCYAELSILVQRSGSDYVYFMNSFNQFSRFWAKLPSYLFSLVMIVVIRPASSAVCLLTFSAYLSEPILEAFCIDDPEVIDEIQLTVAVLGLATITYINITSVKLYVFIQNVFSVFKIVGCLIVVGGGIYEIATGNTKNLNQGFSGEALSPKDVALAFTNGLYAFDGWSMVTSITEEINRPQVNILRSIIIAVPLVTVLYVFMNISYITVLSMEEMMNSSAVAVTFGEQLLGKFAVVIPVSVALATFGSSLSLQFEITRLCYVSGQDGLMVKSLSYVHYKRLTPSPAVIWQTLITLLFILTKNVTKLIQFVSFLRIMFHCLAMVSLLMLKSKRKDERRLYQVPVVFPVFMIFIYLCLTIIPIVMNPAIEYLIALGIMVIATLSYYFFIYKDVVPSSFLSTLNRYVQILFEAVPSQSTDQVKNEENSITT